MGMRKHCNAQEIRKNPEAHEEALQCTETRKNPEAHEEVLQCTGDKKGSRSA
jgi:hypothetical protein